MALQLMGRGKRSFSVQPGQRVSVFCHRKSSAPVYVDQFDLLCQYEFFETLLQNFMFGGMLIKAAAFTASILPMSLAFAYSFLPNTSVHFISAFIGGLATTIILKLTGSVFQGLFVAPARERISIWDSPMQLP
jgi:hypothetical protein